MSKSVLRFSTTGTIAKGRLALRVNLCLLVVACGARTGRDLSLEGAYENYTGASSRPVKQLARSCDMAASVASAGRLMAPGARLSFAQPSSTPLCAARDRAVVSVRRASLSRLCLAGHRHRPRMLISTIKPIARKRKTGFPVFAPCGERVACLVCRF